MGEKKNVILYDGCDGNNYYLKLTKEQIALFNFFDSKGWVNDLTLKIVDDINFQEINNF